ncbi:MAG: ABC transporter ATP-binding protein [Lachnospiraceae bacterium]
MSRKEEYKNPIAPPTGAPGGMTTKEKAKDFVKSLQKLVSYCKKYAPAMCAALVLAVAASVFSLIGPGKLSEITDIITEGMMSGIDVAAVARIGLVLAILYGLSLLFGYGQGFIMAKVSQAISKGLRTKIVEKIDRLPLAYFDKRSYGDTLSRMSNDVDTIGSSLNQSLSSLVSGICMFAGSWLMMFTTNWVMAAAGLLSTVLGFALMLLLIGKSQGYFSGQQEKLGEINGHIEEIYAGHTVVKAYNGEQQAQTQFRRMNGQLYTSAWKSQFLSGLMMPIMMFIGNLSYVAVCVTGAVLAMQGSISFGVIVAFMVYIRLFTQPLSTLAQAATTLQSTAAASERVFEFLDEEEMPEQKSATRYLESAQGNIAFKNVKFGYLPDQLIIKDFSADIKAGQKVAIVGPTGSGKTTLVNLLMRFYEVNEGEITIDGVPMQELTRENVHALFAMVLQDTWLFEGTVKENIIYSKQGVTDAQVIEACKAVGLHHFIKTLPEGYDTVLGDKSSLSDGQKQLVTIARAMVQNADLLILDEATSSVDTRTEVLIQEAMDQLSEGRTSFIIAHRLSTIKNADLILVLKDGNIIESGTHDRLLEDGGFYAELYNSQFEEVA